MRHAKGETSLDCVPAEPLLHLLPRRVNVVQGDKGYDSNAVPTRIEAAQARAAREDGLLLCPEGAATLAAYEDALTAGRIEKDARVMLFNCGSGLKYPMPPAERALDRTQPIDWAALAGAGLT